MALSFISLSNFSPSSANNSQNIYPRVDFVKKTEVINNYQINSIDEDFKNSALISKETFHFIKRELKSQKLDHDFAVMQYIANKRNLKTTQDYINMITQKCSEFGCNANQVINVMYCESTANPNAVNYIYYGLFQHDVNSWERRSNRYGVPGAPITDPYAQIHVTTKMFAEGLSYHWTCAKQ